MSKIICWRKVNDLKNQGIYAKIMSYPKTGIPRSEKHHLVEWLMEQLNEDIWKVPNGYEDVTCPVCDQTGRNTIEEFRKSITKETECWLICECGHDIKEVKC